MVLNLVSDHRPVGLAVAFDLPGGTFRDEIVDDYKGGRDETPADLPPQFDMIRDVLHALAIPVVEAEGFEADDVLATLASEARDRGHPVIIVTGDRDSYQLVEDPYIRVLYNRRGVSDYALYDEAGIEERTGVLPPKYPLLAALRGDPSDNLPGVPGVGEKTAAKLINEYGDLDTLYAHLDALSPEAAPEPGRARRPGAHQRRGHPAGARRPAGRRRRRPGARRLGPRGGPGRIRRARDEGRCGRGSSRPCATGCSAPRPSGRLPAAVTCRLDRGGGTTARRRRARGRPGGWLPRRASCPPCRPACDDLVDLFAAGRSATGNVALAPRWEGDAGGPRCWPWRWWPRPARRRTRRPRPCYLGPFAGGGTWWPSPSCWPRWPRRSGPTGWAWWPTTPRS